MVSELAGVHAAPFRLTLVAPAHNEQDILPRWRSEWTAALDRAVASGLLTGWDAVVVDDGSDDDTACVLQTFVEEQMPLTVVRHERNLGLGAAVRSGLAAATGEVVLYTDIDLPFDPAAVAGLIDALNRSGSDGPADVVSAVRTSRSAEGPRRYVMSLVYNGLVRAAFRLSARDVNFGAKLIRRDALDGLACQSEGSFIDAELLARLQRRGATIAQVELTYQPRTTGVSTLSSWPVVWTILREMVRLAPSIRAEQPLRPTSRSVPIDRVTGL